MSIGSEIKYNLANLAFSVGILGLKIYDFGSDMAFKLKGTPNIPLLKRILGRPFFGETTTYSENSTPPIKKKKLRKKFCPYCGTPHTYCDPYDSFYCVPCNVWLEEECGCHPDECEFTGRPPRPNMEIK